MVMDLAKTLLPCPFCGADETRIGQATMRADDLTIYSVECYDCGAEIADDESQDAADRHWNTRTGQLIVVDHLQATSPVDDRGGAVCEQQAVETVARAMHHSATWDRWEDAHENEKQHYRQLAQAAIAAMPSLAAKDAEKFRHMKRGTIYEVVGTAELQMTYANLVDGSDLVIYRGEDGKLWCREECEFHDGRFQALGDEA